MKLNDKIVIDDDGYFDLYEVVDYNGDNDFSLQPIFLDESTNTFLKSDINKTIHCYLSKNNIVYRSGLKRWYAYKGPLLFAGSEEEMVKWLSKNKELAYDD